MKDTIWVVFTQKGVDRFYKSKPKAGQLSRSERCFKQTVEVGDDLWSNDPIPEVRVNIPVEKVMEPDVDVQVVDPRGVEDAPDS